MGTKEAGGERPSWVQIVLIGRDPNRTLIRVVVLVVVCVVVFKYVLVGVKIEGISMLPTYKEPGIHFVNRLAYRFHEPQRGDVVAIRFSGPHVMLMKRIVGLPGETVAFHAGHLFINGQQRDEPYVKFRCDWEIEPETIGPASITW